MKYVLLFTLLSLLTVTNQQDTFEVLGSSVVVLAGENATLPCHLKPSISAVDLKVTWMKVKSSGYTLNVHVYENQKDVEAEANTTYRGRTSLFREELQKGNVSLKLTQAKLYDSGRYICGVQRANWNEGADVHVSVKGEGSSPMIDIGNPSGWGLELLCLSRGWHPQPELVWLDSEGQVLPAEHIEISRAQDGLYNIKGRVVLQRNPNQITCRIQQKLIDHMLQTKIDVPNNLFAKVYSSQTVFIIGCTLLAVCFALLFFGSFRYKKRKNKKEEKLEKQLDLLNTRKLDYSDVVKYHRTINLDADNAHVDLEVHDKHVHNIGKPLQSSGPNNLQHGSSCFCLKVIQTPVESNERFKKAPCVLAKEWFSSGSHYFIVEVPEKGWIVGVAKASINKEKTTACSVQEGCWTLRHGQGKLSIHDGAMMSLTMTRKAKKVGVFVNCDESFVSFYNVTDHDDTNKSTDHIYTYTKCTFESGNGQKEVYPFFGIRSLKTLNIVDPVTND